MPNSPDQPVAIELLAQLEAPACPLCGRSPARTLLETVDDWVPEGPTRGLKFKVLRCRVCRGCYTSPRFREDFRHIPFIGKYPFYQRARRLSKSLDDAAARPFISRAASVTNAHPTPGRILDLGMGDGVFLALMQKKGWAISGMDTEADVVEYARTKLKLQSCSAGDAERDPLPEGVFDVITLWGLFQLIYRPQALLEKLRSSLVPGGIIGIGVSNFGGAGARIFGKHWNGLGLPRHLVHFEPQSLKRLVERSGYEVLSLSFESPYWLIAESMRSLWPLPGILGGISRRSAAALFATVQRSSIGETMTVMARVRA
jgi:SAM-dependent methyltransferase